jgi:twitching motility protein PilT
MEVSMNIQEIVKQAVELDASDIFFVAGSQIALKIKNDVSRFKSEVLTPEHCQMIVDELYHLANNRNMDKLEKKGDDDFSFSLAHVARLRVNVYHQRNSLAAVIRLVQFDIPTAKELCIPKEITRFSELTRGLVIISGPAGAGKSSTLAVILDLINRNQSGHIVTIEDPIEFLHKHQKSIVTQREVGSDCDTSASALKSALRQAPNVLFISEMRDLETISLAITAAETGHLVFTTLHTLGAANTIDRMVDVFPAAQQQQIRLQLSMVLEAVISQQLIRQKNGELVPVFEVMTNSLAVRNQIRESKTHQLKNTIASSEGMISMDSMLIELLKKDCITLDEALLHSFDSELLLKKINSK